MNLKFTSSDEVGFWVEIEANLIGSGEKAFQNDCAAQQQQPNRLVRNRCRGRKRKAVELCSESIRSKQATAASHTDASKLSAVCA
jgi:hypothetical protein